MKKNDLERSKYEREFLRDFELLVQLTEQEHEKRLYEKANMQKAKEMMAEKYVLTVQGQKYKLGCQVEEFMRFGPGIYLMFKFLKMVTILMGILTIISLIPLLIFVLSEKSHMTVSSGSFKGMLLRTTIGVLEEDKYNGIIVIDIIMVLIMLIALIYWNETQKNYIIECSKETPLTSYFTVILKTIPEDYRQVLIKEQLELYVGEIAQIYTVLNFGNDMVVYKEITELIEQYKCQQAMILLHEYKRCSRRLADIFFSLRNYYIKLRKTKREAQKYPPCFAFIQFRRVESREQVLQDINSFPCFSKPDNYQYEGVDLHIEECSMEPRGIIWENLYLSTTSRILRFLLQTLLMIAMLFLSMILIFMLSSMEISISNSVYSSMDKEEIISTGNSFAKLSYCINLSTEEFYEEEELCGQYGDQFWKLTLMTILIPITISLFKFLLTELMKALVSFRKYTDEIRKIQSQALIIFIFYFSATGLLQLFIYLQTNDWHLSFFKLFEPLIRDILHSQFEANNIILHTDFSENWYKTASSNIIIIAAISFNLSAVGRILYSWLRMKICYYFAGRQELQIKMNEWLEGEPIEIEYIYATALTVLYYTFLFGTCLPLNYFLAFISLLVIYWSNKYVFITYCQHPLTFNHSVNSLVTRTLLIGLIMHCVMTPIFLQAENVGGQNGKLSFFERLASMGYYLGIISIILLYVFFRKLFLLLFRQIKHYCQKGGNNQSDPSKIRRKNFSLPTIIRKIENSQLYESYSMHQNASYKPILKTLYTINKKQRTRGTCILNSRISHMMQKYRFTDKALLELIKIVRRDAHEFKKKKGKIPNPFQHDKQRLYQIYEGSKIGLWAQDEIIEKQESEHTHKRPRTILNSNNERVEQETITEQEAPNQVSPPLQTSARLNFTE